MTAKPDARSRKAPKLVRAAILAAAGALGTLAAQTGYSWIVPIIAPSPYAYLQGTYSGHWEWHDGNHRAQQTRDTVYFETTVSGKLTGHGSDPNLGTYRFEGNLIQRHVSAAYLSDPGSAQPAQSGGFELDVVSLKPLVLKGNWTGFFNGTRIAGPVTLTRIPD